MGDLYEVILDGGGPWGIRLQGGKDFGVPLNIARVTPSSKASNKRLLAGDQIIQINNTNTEFLTHMEAQNLIKNAGNRLQLMLKPGKGASLGDVKQVGSGAMTAQPTQTLYTTDVTHSAGVDHKFNAKPRGFGAAPATSSGPIKKFDPAEYARKKKEELDKYKEEQKKPAVPDSDVLKMLQNTSVSGGKPAGSFSRLENQLQNEGQWPEEEKAFRMTAEGTDLSDASPGSRQVMQEIKSQGASGLSNTGTTSTGSRSYKYLQQFSNEDEDLPPPPPELMGGHSEFGNTGPGPQSGTFKMLQSHLDSGTGDQVQTVFSKPPGQRNQAVPAPPNTQTLPYSPTPKAPMPTGPNFKVGRPSAPTFKPASAFAQQKGPPPPAVNAGEIQNINSRAYNPSYSSPPPAASYSPQTPKSPSAGGGYTSPPGGTVNRVMTKGSPQPVPMASPSSHKDLSCHACQQPLTGPFVSAIGKTWHPEHFCCSACNVSLQNQAFVEENNQLFCEKCYNQYYAPKCAHCNNAIIGNCINALGKSWHPDHFVCSFCNKNFGSDGFLVDSGKPYCEKCFEDLFSVKCGKCSRPITGGEKYVEALNKNWHSDCFTCNVCNVRLEGNSFFVSRGMPHCQNHKSGN